MPYAFAMWHCRIQILLRLSEEQQPLKNVYVPDYVFMYINIWIAESLDI